MTETGEYCGERQRRYRKNPDKIALAKLGQAAMIPDTERRRDSDFEFEVSS